MPRDVFISHAGDDAGVAVEVCALLEQRGLQCWMAPRDVAAGAVWDEAILDAIERSRVFLLILSSNANQSQFVKNEVNRAFSQSKPIVTFRLEEVVPGRSLELYLARHHWTDAFPPPMGARVERLAGSITALLDPTGSSSAASTPSSTARARPTFASRFSSPLLALAKSARTLGRRPLILGTGALLLGAAIAGLAVWNLKPSPQPRQAVRLSADIGVDASLYTDFGPSAILSPDGTRLALVATGSDQKRRIYVRALDQLQATALPGTEDARDPFFSPDGQWIGFFADFKVKKISVQGGAAATLCDAPDDRGGSWGEDGTIVFAPDQGPLSKVSSVGGKPEPLTTLDTQAGEDMQLVPQLLPGGQTVLFTSYKHQNSYDDSDIVVYSIPSGQRKTVLRGGFNARYLPSGHVVYMHEGTLFAVPFSLKLLEVTGQPSPILEGVAPAQFSFSETGNLVYVAGRVGRAIQNVSIYWMDREGKFEPLLETSGDYQNPSFSPDGKRLALEIRDRGRSDIWVYDLQRNALTRLTFAGQANEQPVWTPDGERIAYSFREQNGMYNLWWIRADGAGDAQPLAESKSAQYAGSWRPDGKTLAFMQLNPDTNYDIMTLAIEGNEKSGWKPGVPKAFLNSPFMEDFPAFSPDGRWLAYHSNESGSDEVYVRPFPGPGGKWQISTSGGDFPEWSRNGKELFYRTMDSKIMVLNYTTSSDSFHADKPLLWSPGQFTDLGPNYNFDLHPDGKRFAVLKAPGAGQAAAVNKVSFVFNFFDELRGKVPPGK